MYFLTVLRYIHQNPIKASLASDTEDYKWSSYKEYHRLGNIVDTNFVLRMFSSDKNEALAEFSKFHMEVTNSQCLDTDENKRTLSDKDIKDLVSDRYNIDLFNLQNMEQEIQDGIIKYLKKDREISLRQLSRLTGFTIHRIYKVKV
ncbi:MAG: hypothetical protein WBI21_07530 [Natronincolaceae bacterium]|nr:hypothetical protein [Bacillota bacterium]